MAKADIAVFPGSFDPLTNGHVEIVRRAITIFDKVVVAVLSNPSKSTLFTVDERIKLAADEFSDCKECVEISSFDGLLVDFMQGIEARIILRGLRAISDFDYEAQMAHMNRNLSCEVETLFLTTSEKCSYISSSLVKQVAQFHGDVQKLVPPKVALAVKQKYINRK